MVPRLNSFVQLIINGVVMSGMSALAGMAALATLLNLQSSLQQHMNRDGSPIAITVLGTITGLSLATPLILHGAALQGMSSLSRRLPDWFLYIHMIISTILLLAAVFARPIVAVVVASATLTTDEPSQPFRHSSRLSLS